MLLFVFLTYVYIFESLSVVDFYMAFQMPLLFAVPTCIYPLYPALPPLSQLPPFNPLILGFHLSIYNTILHFPFIGRSPYLRQHCSKTYKSRVSELRERSAFSLSKNLHADVSSVCIIDEQVPHSPTSLPVSVSLVFIKLAHCIHARIKSQSSLAPVAREVKCV